MTDVLRLSNSEMATWRRCKRKWWLGTYRRLRQRTQPGPGSALSIGNLVHDALAAYYDPVVQADPVKFVEGVAEIEIAEWPAFETDIRKELDLVSIMLTGYLEWLEETGEDSDLEIKGAESMVEVELVEGVHLLSKLDAPVERLSDGAKLALEHKTVGSLEQPLMGLKLDTQLLTEHLARFLHAIGEGATPEEAADQCHGILYNMLRKVKRTAAAKPPFYGREDIPHNIVELRKHWAHVLAIAHEIQATTAALDAGADPHVVAYPNPTHDCKWDCSFFKVCVMFDDGSDVEGALDAMFEEGDPLERYVSATNL